jgi:PRTRC genetic system ThiF family protein
MKTSIDLNLDYLHARRLLLPSAEGIALLLVGCGGTGSWLAPSVARIARLLIEKYAKTVRVCFFDPDHVEPKNCYRQNFCQAEVGTNKAETLAFRYSGAWGVPIAAIPEAFDPVKIQIGSKGLAIFIGAVDRGSARREIARAAHAWSNGFRAWWLDCGNRQASGQVLLGSGCDRPKNPFELPEFCSWLPIPTQQHPELEQDEPEDAAEEETLSCADLAMRDSQGLAINQRIAAEATDYLVRMLLTRDLNRFATYLDLAAGSARSRYITPDALKAEAKE